MPSLVVGGANVAMPTNMEAEYLKRSVGSSLAEGLAEVASKRPADPVEYLALWLLKHKVNLQTREEQGALYVAQPPPARAPDQEEETPQTIAVSETIEEPSKDEPLQESAPPTQEDRPAVVDVPTISIEVERSTSKLSRIEEEPEESETTGDKDKNQLAEKPATEQSDPPQTEETDPPKTDDPPQTDDPPKTDDPPQTDQSDDPPQPAAPVSDQPSSQETEQETTQPTAEEPVDENTT